MDRSWIVRQVTSIDPIDTRTYYRKTTYDIDCDELNRRGNICGIPNNCSRKLYLPLRNIAKTSPIDIDIIDFSGRSLALAPGSINSHIASLILNGELNKVDANLSSNTQERYCELFFKLLKKDSLTSLDNVLWEKLQSHAGEQRYSRFLALFASIYANRLFSVNFDYSSHSGVKIIKTREMVQGLECKDESTLELQATSIGTVRSNHICVNAPKGTWIKDVELLRGGEPVLSSPRQNVSDIEKPLYVLRYHYLRTVLSDKRLPLVETSRGRVPTGALNPKSNNPQGSGIEGYVLKVYLRPMRSYFLGPHLATMLLSIVMYGVVLGDLLFQHPKVNLNIGAFVPIMILVPTIYSILLNRTDDHKILSAINKRWRYNGYQVALISIVTSILYAFTFVDDSGVSSKYLSAVSAFGLLGMLSPFVRAFRNFMQIGRDVQSSETRTSSDSEEADTSWRRKIGAILKSMFRLS